jgi:beta-1,2-mannosidase
MIWRLMTAILWPAFAACQPAVNWQIGPFERPAAAPVIQPNPAPVFRDPVNGEEVHWKALHAFNPAAVVRNGKVYVLYRAEDNTGEMRIGMHTSRLGLAESSDGVNFEFEPAPVFYPQRDEQFEREWPGGVEDPRIVETEDGAYILTYTQWNRKKTDIGVASSRDLIHWTKYGPALGTEGKYAELSYKSGGIVTRLVGSKLLAAKIGGKYWMYWGENSIRLATSDDLLHWKPVENQSGAAVRVLEKRAGHFDSSFPEVGPPPILTARGIVVLYNGRNASDGGDPSVGPNAYAVGEALFSADDPARLLERTERPVFQPELPFEKTGQYVAGTTFAEGLVWFHDRWLLYYGCADSSVGVAQVR